MPFVQCSPSQRIIALIPCSKSKLKGSHPAREMYTGIFHKLASTAVQLITDQNLTLIISAKYGLLELNRTIGEYSVKMGEKGCISPLQLILQWESLVSRKRWQPKYYRVISFLTGPYIKAITPALTLTNHQVLHLATEGPSIGYYLQWLKDMTLEMSKSDSPISLLRSYSDFSRKDQDTR